MTQPHMNKDQTPMDGLAEWHRKYAELMRAEGKFISSDAHEKWASEVEAARAQTAAEPTNLHARILEALLDHGLQHTRDDDDAGLPLVDALTRRGDKDIRSGIEEIELLADAIFDAVEPLYASPSFPAPAPGVEEGTGVPTATELLRRVDTALRAAWDARTLPASVIPAELAQAIEAHLRGVNETSDAARPQGNGGANG